MVLKIWFLNTLGTSVFISHSYTLHIRHYTYIKDKETVRFFKIQIKKIPLVKVWQRHLKKFIYLYLYLYHFFDQTCTSDGTVEIWL